jgi:monooxygenase
MLHGATAANPFLDLASGYVKRSLAELPWQGDRAPRRLHQIYVKDVRLLRRGPIDEVSCSHAAAFAGEPARRIA